MIEYRDRSVWAARDPEVDSGDVLEAAIDDALRGCGGDARACIRHLVIALNATQARFEELEAAVSKAYARSLYYAELRYPQ